MVSLTIESCSTQELLCPATLGAGSAVQARLSSPISTKCGRAFLQQQLHQMQPLDDDAATEAQLHSAQLAALLATDAGKALVHQQLSGLLKRQQQQQQQTSVAASHSCANQNSTNAAAALDHAGDSTCSLAELHPGVLSTAIAASRTAGGSTDRAAGLALLRQELVQHAPLPTAMALAASPSYTGAADNPAGANAAAASQAQQQQAAKAPVSPTAESGEGPLTVAMAWAMLQQQRQLQRQDSAVGGAVGHGLMRHDTVQSTQSHHCLRQETADAARFAGLQQQQSGAAAAVAAANAAAAARGSASSQGQQLVFKRRSATSSALRKHFSNAKTVRSEPAAAPAGFAKPQQVFKKQRKRPLVLWSSGSSVSQHMPATKHVQGPAACAPASEPHAAPELEHSMLTGSSSGVTSSALRLLLEARGQMTAGTGAAAAAAPAALDSHASGMDTVLSTLARQEQQLMMLQQQLQQQRRLFAAQRQADAAAAAPVMRPTAAANANAVKAHELELLLGNQATDVNSPTASARAAAMLAASRDVDMVDACQQRAVLAVEQLQQVQQPLQQHGVQAGAPSDALTALKALVDALSNKQQPQQQQHQRQPGAPAHTGWDTDVVRKLTAALLAA